MSDYYLLTQAQDKKTINVAFHIPIPDVNNEAGKSYRLALKEKLEHESETGIITSQIPNLPTAELTRMQSVEIYEIMRSKRFSRLGLTSLQKRNELDAEYNILKIEARDELQVELEWWGLARDV